MHYACVIAKQQVAFFTASANSFIERTGKRSIVVFACLLIRSINGSSPGPKMNKTSPFFELDSFFRHDLKVL